MGEYYFAYWGIGLIIAAALALIPANIAKNKGYSFGLWWFYGWMLFIVAIIHVQYLPDKTIQPQDRSNNFKINPPSPADELKKYKELLDSGAITSDEYEVKKKQLLGIPNNNTKPMITGGNNIGPNDNDTNNGIDNKVLEVIKSNNGKLNYYTLIQGCSELGLLSSTEIMESIDRLVSNGMCKKNENGYFEI